MQLRNEGGREAFQVEVMSSTKQLCGCNNYSVTQRRTNTSSVTRVATAGINFKIPRNKTILKYKYFNIVLFLGEKVTRLHQLGQLTVEV